MIKVKIIVTIILLALLIVLQNMEYKVFDVKINRIVISLFVTYTHY